MTLVKQRIRMILKRLVRLQGLLLACCCAAVLAACSSSLGNKIADSVPGSVGLPEGTPDRPAEPVAFPAVHDMPPPRANSTLSAEEQIQLEDDLVAVRSHQEAASGTAPASTARTAKKRPAPAPRLIPASSSSLNTLY